VIFGPSIFAQGEKRRWSVLNCNEQENFKLKKKKKKKKVKVSEV